MRHHPQGWFDSSSVNVWLDFLNTLADSADYPLRLSGKAQALWYLLELCNFKLR